MEQQLLPLVQQKLQQLKDLCKLHGLYFQVVSTYRSLDEQNKIYAQGRTIPGNIVTNAKGGQSFHNWKCAFDFVPIINGKADWNDISMFSAIAFWAKTLGFEWGGDFPNIKDNDHLQLTLGYSFQDFIDGKVDYTKFGVNASPVPVSTHTEAPISNGKFMTYQKAKVDFQVSEGIMNFANNIEQAVEGPKTLEAMKKYGFKPQ